MQGDAKDRRRVVILAHHLSPLDARFVKMRTSLIDAGFEVSAAAPAGAHVHPDARAVTWQTSFAAPGQLGAFLRARARTTALIEHARAAQPDVIIAFDPETLPAASAAKRTTGARLIYDAHEFHEEEAPESPTRGSWVKRAEMRAAPHLDGFVTVNPSIAQLYATERSGFPDALVVRNAARSAPTPLRDGRLRASAGLRTEDHVLLYHGAMRPLRGLSALVAAAKLIRPWRVVLLGEGPMRDTLAASGADAIFLPAVAQEDLLSWIADADLGAILYEDVGRNQRFATPNKLWELPAAGVPILASDLPEIRDAVLGAGMGWLLPAGASPEAIAALVGTLTPAQLGVAAVAARAFSQRCSWEAEVAPLIDLVRQLAAL